MIMTEASTNSPSVSIVMNDTVEKEPVHYLVYLQLPRKQQQTRERKKLQRMTGFCKHWIQIVDAKLRHGASSIFWPCLQTMRWYLGTTSTSERNTAEQRPSGTTYRLTISLTLSRLTRTCKRMMY